jgi:predicted Zn-dependent peptidase
MKEDTGFPHTEIRTLANGVRIAVTPMGHTQATSLNVTVAAGSRDERSDQAGIAHFLEHMAFKGTKTRSAAAIAEEFDMIGGYLNAATGREHTSYYAKVLSEHTAAATEILADILLNSVFDPDELEKERDVILQEIFMTNDTPDDVLFEIFQESCYGDSHMGHSILGTEEKIGGYGREDLIGFMAGHYTGARLIVSAAGGVDPESFFRQAEDMFGGVAESGVPRDMQAPLFVGGHRALARDLDQSHAVFGLPGYSYQDENYHRLQVLSIILGGGMSSRLFQEVREKRGLAYSVSAFTSMYKDAGLLSVYGGTSPEKMEEMIRVITDEIRKIADGVTAHELQRAKNQIRASVLMEQEKSGFVGDYVARQLLLFDEVRPFGSLIAKIDAIAPEDVMQTARHVLSYGDTPARAYVGAAEGERFLAEAKL